MSGRRRGWLLAVALVACGGLAALVGFEVRSRRARAELASPFRSVELVGESSLGALAPTALAFSRAGDRVFLADSLGVLAFATTEVREGHARPTTLLTFADLQIPNRYNAALSDEGRVLVLGGESSDPVPVEIVDVGSRSTIAVLASACRHFGLSRDGRLAVTHDAYPELTLRAWDVAAGTSRAGPKAPMGSYDVDPPAVRLDVSTTGLVLECFRSGAVEVWNVATGEMRGCSVRLGAARFAGDSGLVAGFDMGPTPGSGTRLTLWDPARGVTRVLWSSPERVWVSRAWASPSGRLLAANLEGSLAVWSLSSPGEPRRYRLPGKRAVVIGDSLPALAFTPDERSVVVGSAQGELLWLDLDE